MLVIRQHSRLGRAACFEGCDSAVVGSNCLIAELEGLQVKACNPFRISVWGNFAMEVGSINIAKEHQVHACPGFLLSVP